VTSESETDTIAVGDIRVRIRIQQKLSRLVLMLHNAVVKWGPENLGQTPVKL
jgi:hypothetical protein